MQPEEGKYYKEEELLAECVEDRGSLYTTSWQNFAQEGILLWWNRRQTMEKKIVQVYFYTWEYLPR